MPRRLLCSTSNKVLEEMPERVFRMTPDQYTARGDVSNRITTSHYTFYTFLPANLFVQFVYYPVNVWFASLAVLQTQASISITNQFPSMLFPLTFILFVHAVKDAIEDYRRHRSDKLENNRVVWKAHSSGVSKETSWKDVQIMDTLLVRNMEYIPADLVVLGSSCSLGGCYVETANLDGESSLKGKNAPPACVQCFEDVKDGDELLKKWHQVEGSIETEPPNGFLYNFAGTLHLTGTNEATKESISLDAKSLLLRGCRLQNTDWIVGKVVYTGYETKIHMSQAELPRKKMTGLERKVMRILGVVFLMQIVFCSIGATINTAYEQNAIMDSLYLNLPARATEATFMFRFFSWILIFSNFVPISLVVTMTMVKFGQSIFIFKDNTMKYKSFRAMPRTSDLNEDLGQVEFVFSDKTGTLTENVMEFRKCCIGGKNYGTGKTQIAMEVARNRANEKAASASSLSDDSNVNEPATVDVVRGKSEIVDDYSKSSSSQVDCSRDEPATTGKVTPNVNFTDPRLAQELLDAPNRMQLYDFFLHIVINHEVFPITTDGELSYSGSPEEVAMVRFAQHFDFKLLERTPTSLKIQVPNKAEKVTIDILVMLEFNSTRKRSSVIVRFVHPLTDKNTLMLYTKGADTVIHARLDPEIANSMEVELTSEMTTKYAMGALRTLVLGYKNLPEEDFKEWFAVYKIARNAVDERQVKTELAAELIEVDLMMQGVTAMEDRLQENVCETIKLMQDAGIKVWMLTGDKVETAMNIGIATGLLPLEKTNDSTVVFDWTAFEKETLKQQAQEGICDALDQQKRSQIAYQFIKQGSTSSVDRQVLRDVVTKDLEHTLEPVSPSECSAVPIFASRIEKTCLQHFNSSVQKARKEPGSIKNVVVDGQSLTHFLKEPKAFVDLTRECESVLCCRVSPDQKGQVVNLMKIRERKVTLAIGDGANDCTMIRSAHIGIGIRGEEGLQAFNTCDYGIAQFHFLRSLLFVHGRYAYRRISITVLYIFYKNIVIVIPQFVLGAWSQFSAIRLYPDTLYQLYNVAFTSFPIIVFGMFDQDIPRCNCFRFPRLYRLGPKNYYLNTRTILLTCLNGFWHSLVIFLIPFLALTGPTTIVTNGKSVDLWAVGIVIMIIEILGVNFQLILDSYSINWISYLCYVLCICFFFITSLFLTFSGGWPETFGKSEGLGAHNSSGSAPLTYVVIMVTFTIAFGGQIFYRVLQFEHWPTPVQLVHLVLQDESARNR
eukprot:GEMP01004623.1.p1 GENE.GEMP01004623.1~~GEMP01004623.1.p1  ORF type:complete len:1233 (+),score=205.55 GEMP01004623.1:186-3884(+)